jgi:hypothetical protein
MKVIRGGVFFLSLLIAGLCQASDSDIEEEVQISSRYNPLLIISEIKSSKSDAYVNDDLSIDKPLCARVRNDDSDTINLLEAEIDKINGIFKNERYTFVQNWSIKLYSNGSILTRRAPVKVRRI